MIYKRKKRENKKLSRVRLLNKKFSQRVIAVVRRIPKGKTLSYQTVATQAGNPKAARVVGTILRRYYQYCLKTGKNTIPCHRVIKSNGKIGGYVLGERVKRKLLEKEGVRLGEP
jgi:O-6-methylguanine DNA methyltransferase